MIKDKIAGAYAIRNNINKKIYVGSSLNIYKRWREHKAHFKNGSNTKNL